MKKSNDYEMIKEPTASAVVVPTEQLMEVTTYVPSAPPMDGGGPRTLVAMVDILKTQLGLEGTASDIVDSACKQLGVATHEGSLIERAHKCHDVLFRGSTDAEVRPGQGKSSVSSFSDSSMFNSSWEAGTSGEGEEAYSSNPWSFGSDHRFVTLRDGCKGSWKLIADDGCPGGQKLRMDWEAGQKGNWAEFALQSPGSIPLFKCIGSSYGFMRSWNIRQSGGLVPVPTSNQSISSSVTTNGTKAAVGKIAGTSDSRAFKSSENYAEAVRKMKQVQTLHAGAGPRPDQLKAYGWFDGQGWGSKWALHGAAMRGDVNTIVSLTDSGTDPNKKMTDWYDSEPLGWAASFNQVDAIVALISAGADPSRPANKAGNTPMSDASREKHTAASAVLAAFLDAKHGSEVSQDEGKSSVSSFPDSSMFNSSWEAGTSGESGEAYSSNPWSFGSDHRFVTLRDGCKGSWKLIADDGCPGGQKLRMDWEAGQKGNWAEFALQSPGSIPLFKCIGSSYGFMRSWNIRQSGGLVPVPTSNQSISSSVTTNGTKAAVGKIAGTSDSRAFKSSENYAEAVRKMKQVQTLHAGAGPRPDQLKAYGWFDGQGWGSKWALHGAAMRGDVNTIVSLTDSGTDPNKKMTDWYDSEPLGWAASFNQVDAIVALISAGADPSRPANKAGNTPMSDASREKHTAASAVLAAFLDAKHGGVHAGQGARKGEYEANYAHILFPIAGHPEFDKGAYYHPLGCCCYVTDRAAANPDTCSPFLCAHLTIACWVGTLCYQPCGIICAHQCPWLGDCIYSEQRVTHSFVEKYPSRVSRGPAKERFDRNEPSIYR